MTPEISRRSLLTGTAGLATLAAAVSPLVAATAQTATVRRGPWDSDDVPAASRSSRRMAATAQEFLDTLSTAQRAKTVYPRLGDAARTKWSNFPASFSPRAGISIAELTDAQRARMHELLRASTSSQGYHKMTGAIRADDVLHDIEGGNAMFGAANYFVSVFGSPHDANWAWMLTGHHMTAIFTVAGDRTAFTPMFTGAQPLQIPTGLHAGWQVLPHDTQRAGELLASLSADQQRVAVIGAAAPGDVLAGPGRQASLATFQGIAAGRLGDGQQRLLWLLVQEFVHNADTGAAEAQLALVKQHWSDTHFSWQGPSPDPAARYYFRVHGPRILIEYDVQEPLTRNGGHVHAITRDPANDYGMDWLGLHYQESSAMPNGPGGPGGPPNGPPGPPPHTHR
ncbi:MAG TPA: DUF3500 domain-containing protein [Candidatus Elarobacter sp.]|jgi:hypothetical protein|nr:DUF3500 domain-containing protein [Candidatus Elarobacter sp.]